MSPYLGVFNCNVYPVCNLECIYICDLNRLLCSSFSKALLVHKEPADQRHAVLFRPPMAAGGAV